MPPSSRHAQTRIFCITLSRCLRAPKQGLAVNTIPAVTPTIELHAEPYPKCIVFVDAAAEVKQRHQAVFRGGRECVLMHRVESQCCHRLQVGVRQLRQLLPGAAVPEEDAPFGASCDDVLGGAAARELGTATFESELVKNCAAHTAMASAGPIALSSSRARCMLVRRKCANRARLDGGGAHTRLACVPACGHAASARQTSAARQER